ncbi:MAG: alanyl-tRNA editing protein, partial [[Eubacterium] sulci]|nr:alanyl-tRNA editing protein [[Eubacterium] sulci]
MKTIKLFQSDVYRRIADAVVLQFDKNHSKNTSCLVLDSTIFFPTGGGQSCDLGTINGFEVIDVFEKENIVYHILK